MLFLLIAFVLIVIGAFGIYGVFFADRVEKHLAERATAKSLPRFKPLR